MDAMDTTDTGRRPWTAREDAELCRLSALRPRLNCAAIARELGRTTGSVCNRRTRLGARGCRRRPPGRAEAIADSLRLDPSRSDAEVARAFGVSRMTAARARAALALPALSRKAWSMKAADTLRARRAPRALDPTRREAELLAHLERGPATVRELATRLGRSENSTYLRLYGLRAKGHAFAEGVPGRGKGKTAAGEPASGTTWTAVNWWLLRHDPLVWSIARKVAERNPHVEAADLAGVMRLAVYRCVRPFAVRGIKFCTYAMKSAQADATLYAMTELRRGVHVSHHVIYDPEAGPKVNASVTPRDSEHGGSYHLEILDRDRSGAPPVDPAFWEKAVAGLRDREGRVVVAYFRDGLTYAAVGKSESISKERVRQIVGEALARIRAAGTLDEFAPAC